MNKSAHLARRIQAGASNAELHTEGFTPTKISTMRRRLKDGAVVSEALDLVLGSPRQCTLAEALAAGTPPRSLMADGFSAQDILAMYGLLRRRRLLEPWTGTVRAAACEVTPDPADTPSIDENAEASNETASSETRSTTQRLEDLLRQGQDIIENDPAPVISMVSAKLVGFMDGLAKSLGELRSCRFLYAHDYQAGTDLEVAVAFHVPIPEPTADPDEPSEDAETPEAL